LISRRRFALGAAAAAMSAAGTGLLVRSLQGRPFQHLGPYAALLEQVVAEKSTRVEMLGIGNEYLRSHASRDALSLLRELAPVDLQTALGDAEVTARRLREAGQARIRDDFERGALLRLNGYFLPESLAKLCAAAVLALRESA
jgi:hypothetical protein